MDLKTQYLGLELPHPLMPGASPLSTDLDTVKTLEDAGAAAITLPSLFEEQITGEISGVMTHLESHGDSFAEAMSYFPDPDEYAFGPDEYLEHLSKVKQAVGIPVIGSLNGTTQGGWLRYARLMEKAGADALEINLFGMATDPAQSASDLEEETVSILSAVRDAVTIPVTVKLSPFYTALTHLTKSLADVGVDGFVVFNRFYQPDIDMEELEVIPALQLSDSSELRLRIRWLAVLSGMLPQTSLAVTGGVHTAADALKAVMAGAHAVQMVSCLLKRGPGHLGSVREEMAQWLEEHEYESLEQMRGSMNLQRCPDPKAYTRGNYMKMLQSWHG